MTCVRILAALALLATAVQGQAFPDCSRGPLASNQVCNTTLDAWSRAAALVAALTTQEKVQLSEAESPAISRIGIPKYTWWNEALHGVARSRGVSFANSGNFSYATSFPQPLVMGAAFDMPLIRAVAETTSTEARAFSNAGRCGLTFWTPNINPCRDPRWGRCQEVPSEDAFFMSTYVNELIPGLQGGLKADPFWKLVATCKHYAGYDIENWQGNRRYAFNAKITQQDLRDYHMPPFQNCARDLHAQSIMCSYNAVNGIPTCVDPWLMNTLLRKHWKWEGPGQFVTSDCDSLQNVYADHRYKNMNAAQAAAEALKAGCDLDCGDFWPRNLGAALNQRLVDQKTLDDATTRRFASLVQLGYFDPAAGQPYRQLNWAHVATPDARALALRAATEGLVLLKNAGGTLPLPKAGGTIRRLAVVGPLASATTQMQGNYYGIARGIVSPAAGFQNAGFTVTTAAGCDVACGNTGQFAAAVNAARQADAVIFVGGIDNSIETEDKDRNDITWPGRQLELVRQLGEAAGPAKPFIVVQMGTMVDSSELVKNENVDALLWAGYPGQDGGVAIANIITGVNAPAGRLPVTQYPGTYTRDVRMTDMNLQPGTGNPGRTYKWYAGTPVFEFGYGLHYTSFTQSLRPSSTAPLSATFDTASLIAPPPGASGKPLDLLPFASVPVEVTNTGNVTSDFVVLAFLKGEFGPKPYPRKSLVAFTRLHNIPAHGNANATLSIHLGSVARSDEKGDLVLFPGNYSLVLDLDEQDAWNFTITGAAKVLDSWPARN